MGLFGSSKDDDIKHADLDCSPQNDFSREMVAKVDDALADGDQVHYVLKGGEIQSEEEWQTLTGKAYLAVTQTRTVGKQYSGLGNDVATVSIDHKNVSSVEFRAGRIISKIVLKTEGTKYTFFNLDVTAAVGKEIVDFIREADSGRQSDGEDPLDQLERLRDLRDDGVITDEELEEKKSELLDQI